MSRSTLIYLMVVGLVYISFNPSQATVCPALNMNPSNGGRCGEGFGRCNKELRDYAKYCNEASKWCGTGSAHKDAQSSDIYDYEPSQCTPPATDQCEGYQQISDCASICSTWFQDGWAFYHTRQGGYPNAMARTCDICWWAGYNLHECYDTSAAAPVPGFITLELAKPVLYGGAALILLLTVSLLYLVYAQCSKSKKRSHKYSKVDMIVSSDKDMQHLKNQI